MREPIKQKIDLVSIERVTSTQRIHKEVTIERASVFLNDPDRKNRIATCECLICYNGGRQGGTMSTQVACALCGETKWFNNTCVDVLCLECAKLNELCKHCGCDIDLKNKRRKALVAKNNNVGA